MLGSAASCWNGLPGSRLQTSNPGRVRWLTTQREKVKVLLVLYDGGEHAKQVC